MLAPSSFFEQNVCIHSVGYTIAASANSKIPTCDECHAMSTLATSVSITHSDSILPQRCLLRFSLLVFFFFMPSLVFSIILLLFSFHFFIQNFVCLTFAMLLLILLLHSSFSQTWLNQIMK